VFSTGQKPDDAWAPQPLRDFRHKMGSLTTVIQTLFCILRSFTGPCAGVWQAQNTGMPNQGVRPMSSSGRPLTGFARPGTSSARPGSSSNVRVKPNTRSSWCMVWNVSYPSPVRGCVACVTLKF
jgi:hypothetical protein